MSPPLPSDQSSFLGLLIPALPPLPAGLGNQVRGEVSTLHHLGSSTMCSQGLICLPKAISAL